LNYFILAVWRNNNYQWRRMPVNIQQARKLQPGNKVKYPSDRGSPAGIGEVTSANLSDSVKQKNIHGTEFIWVSVRHSPVQVSVWPSHRLST
jgi:hypothetical protein